MPELTDDAPHIRAQVYAEVRQLAVRYGAEYPDGDDGETCCDADCHRIWRPFADLIGGGETDGDDT